MSEMTTAHGDELVERVRREVPSLDGKSTEEVARVIRVLVESFDPERIYLFGSQARDDATEESDVDLLIVLTESDKPRYQRAQEAYFAVGLHSVSLDLIVVTRAEFDDQMDVPSSLPATVLREGKQLYAA